MNTVSKAAVEAPVTVRELTCRVDWRALLELPATLHGSDAAWVRPLDFSRRQQWSPRHPWFEHARARCWLARRDGEVVGSISAQVDDLAADADGRRVGYFGQLEAIEDEQVFRALMTTAAEWLVGQGCSLMRGPFDLGINQSCGLLVEGFERPPMLMMGHARPYYGPMLERLGLVPAIDMLAYMLAPDFTPPPAMGRIVERLAGRLEVRAVAGSELRRHTGLLRELFNDAWADNWGFVPITEAEFTHMAAEMKPLLAPDYVQIAWFDGEPAGFIVALPNVNELIADLDGRLLPIGWLKMLWRLKRRLATTARVPLMGVRRRHQRGMIGGGIAFSLIERLRWPLIRDGVKMVELSWILETNKGMRSMIESLGGHCDKRYRIYQQPLGPDA